jgi:hypothetical protein
LFWGIKFDEPDLHQHRRFIIARILEHGNWPDFGFPHHLLWRLSCKGELLQVRPMEKIRSGSAVSFSNFRKKPLNALVNSTILKALALLRNMMT